MRSNLYTLSNLFYCFLILLLNSCAKTTDGFVSLPQNPPNESGNNGSTIEDTVTSIDFDNKFLQYEGRVDIKKDGGYLFWPGTTVRMKFYGNGVSIILEDDKINVDRYANYFDVIIDGKVLKRIKLGSQKEDYLISEELPQGEHVIELFKLNSMHPSYPRGYAKLYGFEIKNGDILPPPKLKNRKMEFYGNSITCGYGNEHISGSDNSSQFENNYMAFGAITARHFDAQYYCIAQSGITLMKSNSGFNLAEISNQLNPFYGNVKWDFKKYIPDIVVVNILQNDASRLPDEPIVSVKNYYKTFILSLRNKYPEAHIICTLGPMNAITIPKWPEIVSESVDELKDNKVYTLFFDYLGRSGHPKLSDHQAMAEKLIGFIENNENINW